MNFHVVATGGGMELIMSEENKMKSTRNGKKDDKKFRSKNIKHDPLAESARAVFGLNTDHVEPEK